MIATPSPLVESHRSPDEWVPRLCEQFSDATGWPLRFVSASHVSRNSSADRLESCWIAEVRDGHEVVGQLRLDRPHSPEGVRSFATVSQLSKTLAELVAGACTASRRLDIGAQKTEPLAKWTLSTPHGSELLCSIKQLLRAGLQLTGFHSACLFLLEPASEELRLRAVHQIEPHDIPQPTRALRNEPLDLQVLTSGTRVILRRGDRQSEDSLPINAAIGFCIPVQAHCGMLGTLWFFDRRARSIDPREKQLLDSLSTELGSLLERVILRTESETHDRLRLEVRSLAEMDEESPTKSLRQSSFEATWRVDSRFEIGGDLCEIAELSDHEVAILIGDATGNSVPAAVVMTAVHGALSVLMAGNRDEARDTARVLSRVNQSLFLTRRLPHFMSLVYGVLDTRSLKFTYSNAGHPSPILVRNGDFTLLNSRGILLGIVEGADYPSETIDLQPSDLFVAYSDGISEARSSDAQFFGQEGVLRSLGPKPQDENSSTLLNRVWNQQTAFAAPGPADDRSLLIARITP